jgi:signal transduction histidine kinase
MKDFTKRTGIRVCFTAFAEVEKMSNAKRTMFYRVTQSALTNVAQHAHANCVKVTLQRLANAAVLEIRDDGRGFEVEQVLFTRGRRRLGLLGMRERVEMVGGNFSLDSSRAKGTTIRAQVAFANGSKVKAR